MHLRRALSIVLICIIAYQCVGLGWMHWWQLEAWRAKQWEALESGESEAEVQVLEVADLDALGWHTAREFEYHGLRYDLIAQHRLPDGHWRLQCVMDGEETELESGYEAGMAGHDHDADHLPGPLRLKMQSVEYLAVQALHLQGTETAKNRMCHADWAMRTDPFLDWMDRPPCLA